MTRILAIILLLLTGCGRQPAPDGGNPENPLEAAARDRGVVRTERAPPTGIFERRHDLGRDALCVAPEGGDDYRFALTASYGPGLVCQGQGRLEDKDGDWHFAFDGASDCSFTAREADDELRIPGNLPANCANLCPNRASISGLRLPRSSWDADEAAGVRFARPDGKAGVGCAP